jgi:hypothetical protein
MKHNANPEPLRAALEELKHAHGAIPELDKQRDKDDKDSRAFQQEVLSRWRTLDPRQPADGELFGRDRARLDLWKRHLDGFPQRREKALNDILARIHNIMPILAAVVDKREQRLADFSWACFLSMDTALTHARVVIDNAERVLSRTYPPPPPPPVRRAEEQGGRDYAELLQSMARAQQEKEGMDALRAQR